MADIENKKVKTVLFEFFLDEERIGNANCIYDYNSVRESYTNLLIIEINFIKSFKNVIIKPINEEIDNSGTTIQAFNLVRKSLSDYSVGIEIKCISTSYEFNFIGHSEKQIRLTRIVPAEITYEVLNLSDNTCHTLRNGSELGAIDLAYENFVLI